MKTLEETCQAINAMDVYSANTDPLENRQLCNYLKGNFEDSNLSALVSRKMNMRDWTKEASIANFVASRKRFYQEVSEMHEWAKLEAPKTEQFGKAAEALESTILNLRRYRAGMLSGLSMCVFAPISLGILGGGALLGTGSLLLYLREKKNQPFLHYFSDQTHYTYALHAFYGPGTRIKETNKEAKQCGHYIEHYIHSIDHMISWIVEDLRGPEKNNSRIAALRDTLIEEENEVIIYAHNHEQIIKNLSKLKVAKIPRSLAPKNILESVITSEIRDKLVKEYIQYIKEVSKKFEPLVWTADEKTDTCDGTGYEGWLEVPQWR